MGKKKRARNKKKEHRPARPSLEEKSGHKNRRANLQAAKGQAGHRLSIIRLVIVALVIIGGVCGLWYLASKGKNAVKKDDRLNILLITMDTTRADRLGCYGYTRGKTPNLDSLAQKGVRFENVYCQVPLTLPSHCSIMTGTYPIYHNVHNNGSYVLGPEQLTLAEVLKEKGLKTAAFVASFSVDSRFGLDQGFDVYDDNFQPGVPFKALNSERQAEQVFNVFSPWLEKNAGNQFFCWIHFFDPHLPYHPPSPYLEQFAENPYDGEIAYMDYYIGAVIAKLKEKNILDRTLIVLAGDHGEAFGEKVETGHGVFLYDGTMRVPLIFYAENHLPRGKVVRGRVRLIDIMPTVLDLVNLPNPAPNQGTSLVAYLEGRRNSDLESYIETYYPRENYGWSELVGLVDRHWKFIRAPKPELYNLESDPKEDQNFFGPDQKMAAEMGRSLDDLIKKSAGARGPNPKVLTAEEEERLRSLGYTSFSGGAAKSTYPDPKDQVGLLKLMQQAEGYEFEKNYAAAEDIYQKLLAQVPDSPAGYVNLALSQARQQKFDQAIQTLIQGTEKIPDSEILLSRLGHTYLVTGRFKEAFEAMADVLRINPRNVDALTVSAGVMETQRNKEEARRFYEKAIAIEPESKYLRMSYALNLASSGKINEGIAVYRQLVEDYPNDAVLYQYLGIAYGVSGDYAKSIESLKQAVYIHPTPTAYYNLAVACKKTGDMAEAVRYLRSYLADPKGESETSIRDAQAELQNLEKAIQK
jgi:arylsulfatase A-like enzyme/tetratricopeptide (TPR) repeat protein